MELTARQMLSDSIYALAKVLREEASKGGSSLMLAIYVTVSGLQNLVDEVVSESYKLNGLNDELATECDNLRGRIQFLEGENFSLRNPPSPAPLPGMSDRVKNLALGITFLEGCEGSSKIAAIKVLREENYLGLKEAKERVEAWMATRERN